MERPYSTYTAIAGLLDYPVADFAERLTRCQELLATVDQPPSGSAAYGTNEYGTPVPVEACERLADFAAATGDRVLDELEELYTRTFDFSPGTALEIGWHLFGEDYNRGAMLVRLRDELARHDIEETRELPDHLIHVLPLVDRMSPDEARKFSQACVLPAVEKMIESLAKKENPYENLLRCVALMLSAEFGREATRALPVLSEMTFEQPPPDYYR